MMDAEGPARHRPHDLQAGGSELYKKARNHKPENKVVSSLPPWFLLQLLPCVPALAQ